MAADARLIPRHIRASSPKELELLMLRYQLRFKKFVHVINIAQDVKSGDWLCWFHDKLSDDQSSLEQLKELMSKEPVDLD